MNPRGERVLIFGDSTSHPGADSAPIVQDVTQGSNRISSQPGDLLASLMLEQGAAAARVNAKIGRSAISFLQTEDANGLIQQDAAWGPTIVIVILGTNDADRDLNLDAQAMTQIRDAYKSMGAEVWAVGPWTYTGRGDYLNAKAPAVLSMMQGVFGKAKTIDARPLAVMDNRAGDGIHFTAASAPGTAVAVAQKLLSASGISGTVIGAAIGFAAILAVGLGVLAYRRKRAPGVAGLSEPRAAVIGKFKKLIEDPDPGSMDVAADLLLQNNLKLSEVSRDSGTMPQGIFYLNPRGPTTKSTLVSWRCDRMGENYRGGFNVFVDGAKIYAPGAREMAPGTEFSAAAGYQGSLDYCKKSAAADAWAIAKNVKKRLAAGRDKGMPMRANISEEIAKALDQDNSEPAELYGTTDRQETRERFTKLLRDDDPASMDVAEDLLLESGWKMREATGGFRARNFGIEMRPMAGPPHEWKMVGVSVYPSTRYVDVRRVGKRWQPIEHNVVARSPTINADGAGYKTQRGAREAAELLKKLAPHEMTAEYSIANGRVRVERYERFAMQPDEAKKAAVATAWAIAKGIKPLALDTDLKTIERVTDAAIDRGLLNMEREELFGSRADREIARKSYAEEQKAVHDYGERIKRAEDPRLVRALKHARREEQQHAASFKPLRGHDKLEAKREIFKLLRERTSDAREVARDIALDNNMIFTGVVESSYPIPEYPGTWEITIDGKHYHANEDYPRGTRFDFVTDDRRPLNLRKKRGRQVYASLPELHRAAPFLPGDSFFPDGLLKRWINRWWPDDGSEPLTGPNMLKTIAAESKSPEEFARRAEAWSSAEAKPPGDKALTRYYPGVTTKMINEARSKRLQSTRHRFQRLIKRKGDPEETADLFGLRATRTA